MSNTLRHFYTVFSENISFVIVFIFKNFTVDKKFNEIKRYSTITKRSFLTLSTYNFIITWHAVSQNRQ